MASVPTVQELVERNRQIAQSHKPIPKFSDLKAMGISMAKTVIIGCMDPRIVPEQFLGLKGPEALVLRNVCGHTAQELAPLLALDTLLDLKEIMIIHHTDCGSNLFTENGFRQAIKQRVEGRDTEIDALPAGGSIQGQDLVQTVLDDMAIIKNSPLVRKELADNTFGFTYDIQTGILTSVSESNAVLA